MDHILSIVLFTPLVGLLVLLFIPSSNARAIKIWANLAALAGFLVSLPLVIGPNHFDPNKDFQFVECAPWIPSIGANYHLGVDGLGVLLVMLTTLIGVVAFMSSWNAIQDRLKEYYACFLVLQTAMLGVFMSLDFLLFFVFWELVLVPMYFIIAIWGGQRRRLQHVAPALPCHIPRGDPMQFSFQNGRQGLTRLPIAPTPRNQQPGNIRILNRMALRHC